MLNSTGLYNFQRQTWKIKVMLTSTEMWGAIEKQDLPSQFKKAHQQAVLQKATFFATFAEARRLFGLPLETSLFFRGSCFEQREINIFDVNQEHLQPFINSKNEEDSSIEDLLKKTCLKIENTLEPKKNYQDPEEQDIQDSFFNKKHNLDEIVNKKVMNLQQQGISDAASDFALQFITDSKNDRSQLISKNKSDLMEAVEEDLYQDQITDRLFTAIPKIESQQEDKGTSDGKKQITSLQLRGLHRKIAKVTLRKNSTRRNVSLPKTSFEEKSVRQNRKKRLVSMLPPKPQISKGNPKDSEKLQEMYKLAGIALKDVRESFRRWKCYTKRKAINSQKFGLMVMQPGKELQKFTLKSTKKLYGKNRLAEKDVELINQKLSHSKETQFQVMPFDLINIRKQKPLDPFRQVEEKIVGTKKIQIIQHLEKTPILLSKNTKLGLLKNLMQQVDDVADAVDQLKEDYDNGQRHQI